MKITIKLAKAFDKYKIAPENEVVILDFEKPVPVKTALNKLMIPDKLPKLILINGMVRNEEHVLQDGDTLSIFPKMSGGY